VWVGVGAFLADPYFQWTMVKAPFQTRVLDGGRIELFEAYKPSFSMNWLAKGTAYARAGARIVIYRRLTEKSLGTTTPEVIRNIHAIRFDPTKPYVITGTHYSDLYVRNLGIFFNELTNEELSAASDSPTNLQDRQRIALQTVALDLAFLQSTRTLVTTIAPLGGSHFTGVNFYEEPSDSLHAVLFTLQKLDQSPATHDAAVKLKETYRDVLQQELTRYIVMAIDPQSLMIKKSIHLSAARDGVKREAAFYDTVIAWKTVQLASQQQLISTRDWPMELQALTNQSAWRDRILEHYWQEDGGFFANDLSLTGKTFSGDSLIALSTGFLNPVLPDDLSKLERMAQHIRAQQLDQPFPLQYSATNKQNKLHPTVRIFAPEYMGEGIWSHWGIEYIKLLEVLGTSTLSSRCEYLDRARSGISSYTKNISQFGGYPELYDAEGKPFETTALRAVMHTGWVVNFEAAQRSLDRHLRTTSCQF